jgi:hypothetical protein
MFHSQIDHLGGKVQCFFSARALVHLHATRIFPDPASPADQGPRIPEGQLPRGHVKSIAIRFGIDTFHPKKIHLLPLR